MFPAYRAAGSSYYCLAAYKKSGGKPSEVNENPFNGMGGEAKWIEYIDDTNFGFNSFIRKRKYVERMFNAGGKNDDWLHCRNAVKLFAVLFASAM